MIIYDPQKLAITTINKNLAVNAGAGTGKTKVLTERYVYILENGDLEENREIESIVAITFTKKATQEMILRIRSEIKKNFHKDPVWKRYYRDLEQANISTIHSFCGKILRENPIEANIDPLFEVLEDDKAAKLLNNAISHILNESLESDDSFMKLMKEFGVNRIESLVSEFYSIYNNIRTVGLDFKAVKIITLEYLNSLSFSEEDLLIIKETIIYLSLKIPKNSKLCKMVSNEDPKWINFYNKSYKNEELYSIIEYIQSNLGNSTKEIEHFEKLRKSIVKVLKTKDKDMKWLYILVLDLLTLIDKEYEEMKSSLAALDYDDLQIKVLKLLDNEEVRKNYQNKFKYFMIDEFQDTNELQRKIFHSLTSVNDKFDQSNLFIVGDPKQSIYGFRGSDIDVFYSTIDDIKNTTNEDPITMSKNYRTKSSVLNFINHIFNSLMGEKYDSLIANVTQEESIDIEILENNDFENYPELNNSEAGSIFEANLIAKRIKTLVNQGKYNYKDFALLFRSTTRNYIYEEAFKNFNIPYFNSSSKRFYFKQEILDIINALKLISNPYDHIATIGFLRSPMIGITDDCIYHILKNKEDSIYQTLINLNDPKISNDDLEKINEALELLKYFYHIKDIKTVTEVTEEIIEKTFYVETLLLKANGQQSMINIYKFIEIIKSFEIKNKSSLEDFIDYINEVKKGNESEANIDSEDSNVVKILTIHKSKGLEFPVVIIPEMSRDSGGRFPNLLFHKDLGIGIKNISSSGIYDEIKEILTIKENQEKERVLYVAMTRAEDMLILGNQGKNSGFKKMIGELMDINQYKIISNIDLDMESSTNIKLLKPELILPYEEEISVEIPLLFDAVLDKKFEFYSISQYLVFSGCNRKYYMEYYHGNSEIYRADKDFEIEMKILNAIDKGNIIHKFAQLYNSSRGVEELLSEVTLSFGFDLNNQIKNELTPYIDNYLNIYSEEYDQVFLEKPFHIKIGNSYLNGIIDRINIKGDEIEVVDLKTNRLSNKSILIEEYTPQLLIYAYAVGKILNKPVTKASILFLVNGEKIDISLDENEIMENIKNVNLFIDFVENNSSINNYKKTLNCKYCKYESICY